MSILVVILVLVALGVILWLVNKYIPMDAMVKRILNIVVIVLVVIWLLKIFGVWGMLLGARI